MQCDLKTATFARRAVSWNIDEGKSVHTRGTIGIRSVSRSSVGAHVGAVKSKQDRLAIEG
jgi:hypothetical protein